MSSHKMNKIETYQAMDNQIEIKVLFEKENVWLSQKQMAVIFDVDITTIEFHLKNIYAEEKLNKESAVKFFPVVQIEGNVTREVLHYNLDVIIIVGRRVNFIRCVQFRLWVAKRFNDYWANDFLVQDYLVKGYSINEKRFNREKY